MYFAYFILSAIITARVSSRSLEDDVEITLLDVPLTIVDGNDVEFRCEFNSSIKMYSIKWYRNDKEFFYFIPTLRPPKRVLKMPGVDVDVTKSNGRNLFLRRVNLDTEGRFKCEVSTEWPHYYTADKSNFVTVVIAPHVKPMIYGAVNQFHFGEELRLLCVSSPSKPEANMSWIINGREAPFYLVEREEPSKNGVLSSSRISLNFIVTQNHFIKGKLVLRCVATVATNSIFEDAIFKIPLIEYEKHSSFPDYSTSGFAKEKNKAFLTFLSLVTNTIFLFLTKKSLSDT